MRPNYTRDEAKELGVSQFIGHDGRGFNIGDTVEAYGRRYKVTGASLTDRDRVHVASVTGRGEGYVGPEKAFKRV